MSCHFELQLSWQLELRLSRKLELMADGGVVVIIIGATVVMLCGNPVPTLRARRPRGKVVDGIYRLYPPAGVNCGAMENTCGGGRRRAGHILKAVPRFPSRESWKYLGTSVFL